MKAKRQFYIVTFVLLATMITLFVGSTLKQDVNTLTNLHKQNAEQSMRLEMESLLQIARESVTQTIKINNLDITQPEQVSNIVEQCIKPLNVESTTGNIVLIQVQPSVKIIYSKKPYDLTTTMLNKIVSGIDSKVNDNMTYDISNDKVMAEWVGIPPGIGTFSKNNTKWVLIIEKDLSTMTRASNLTTDLKNEITYRLYVILIISCLVVIIAVMTIYKLQYEQLTCPKKDSCPYRNNKK